jgi:hypothetical protein
MLSRGSPDSSCIVNRYACAATRAASGVSGMILPTSSAVENDERRFCVRYSAPGRFSLPLLCFGHSAFLCLSVTYHCVPPIVFYLLRCWIHSFSSARFPRGVDASCAGVGHTGIDKGIANKAHYLGAPRVR